MNEQLFSISSTIYCASSSLTTAAVAIGSPVQNLTELVIQAHPDNTANVLIGSSTTQAYVLQPGGEFNCPIRNPSLIYAKMASGTGTLNLIGRSGE